MTAAQQGDTVVVRFRVHTIDGRLVAGTHDKGQETLVLGEARIFPAVEAGIVGMEPEEQRTIVVPAAQAFGPHREEMVVKVPRENFPADAKIEAGMQVQAEGQDGTKLTLHVLEVGEDAVTMDANHPLAGEDLYFSVTLVEVTQSAAS